MLSDLQKDLRYGLRILTRKPLYLFSVALTLGVAIGGTTAVFTYVNGVLLRPLDYPDPDRLVKICERGPELDEDWCLAAPGNLHDWQRSSRTLEALGLARDWPFALKRENGSRALRGGFATPGTFNLLGVKPVMGRLFESSDLEQGSQPVALLSYSFWKTEWASDPDMLGRLLRTDALDAEVIGLLPEGFTVPDLEAVEVWISFPPEWVDRRDWRGFRPFGLMREDVTLAQAQSEIQTIADDLARRYPEFNEGYTARVVSLHAWMVDSIRRPLWVFMSAVFLVLLIATANVSNLVLVRNSGRRREFAIRTAMGASQGRLTLQLLVENGVLALMGVAFGIPLCWILVELVRILSPANLPRFESAQLDVWVLLFSFSISFVICLFLAFIASRGGGSQLSETLAGTRQSIINPSGNRMRSLLVVAEVGLAVLLLVGASLLTRSLFNLLDWQPGFEVDHVMAAFLSAPVDKYTEGVQVSGLFQRSIEATAGLPGVVAAGATSAGPLFGGGDGQVRFLIEDRPPPASSAEYPRANRYDMFPTYFSTIGIALKKGRYFNAADTADSPKVAIVNETLARRHWNGTSPVGQRVRVLDLGDEPVTMEVVGVVADVPPFRPDQPPAPEIYWPLPQAPRWGTMLVVRTAIEPATVSKSIHTRLADIDPDLQVGSFRTLRELSQSELVRPRFFLFLMTVFAAMALILAAIGVYGVITSMVSERTFEIAIRMAMGADRGNILRLMLGRGMLLGAIGMAAGLGGAILLAPLLEKLLVAVDSKDWISLGAAVLLLGTTCVAGCYLPARRASRLDPATAIRISGN